MTLSKPRLNAEVGFTLTEMVIIVMIIGILGITVMPKRNESALMSNIRHGKY